MKILAEYKFQNDKRITVELLTTKEIKKRGYNSVDNFALVFESRGERTEIGLRPDEIVQIITLLSYSLYITVSSYGLKLLKRYNGFRFAYPYKEPNR